jgi:LPS O-antigen subunit length determinant protein (WzzB/FepE family)
MLANMREGYIIETIDPSFVPETKISPNRALYCILATFIGFFFSLIIIAFLKVMKLN